MNHKKYTENRRNIKQKWYRKLLFMTTFLIVINAFLAVGIVATAKDNDIPMYKYYKSYMVEKNDTLFSIAYDMNSEDCSEKQIKECVNEMIAINSLDHKGTICYGNYIIVPYYSTEYR